MRPYLWLALAFCLGFLATQWLGLLAMVLIAAVALVGMVGWCVALEVLDHTPRLRAAHDHDKETPPKGWSKHGNDCTGCGFHIPDDQTVILTNRGEVYHVDCAREAGK